MNLVDGSEINEKELVETLETVCHSLANGESSDSREVPGTPFRITSTAAWARRCIRTTKAADIHPIDITTNGRPPSQEQVAFVEDLTRASSILEETWPETWHDIRTTIRYVVPFRGQPNDSFTSARTFGAVYITPRLGDAVALAEALLHEARHNRLLMLQRRVRLYDNDNDCRYWSAWRQTDRPLRGILHGVYAFTGVCRFHGLLLRKGFPLTPLGLRRIMEESDRVFSMLKLLNKYGRWTSDGRKVLDELEDESFELFGCRDFLVQHLCPGYVPAPYKREVIRELLAGAALAGDRQSRQ